MGIELTHVTSVGDNRAEMTKTLRLALKRSEIIILTGGLGPTEDDLTREVVAHVVGRELTFRQHLMGQIEAHFRRRGTHMVESNKRQAFVPEGAIPIENPVGTAPAAVLQIGVSTLVSLPGVPEEMKGIYEETLQPILKTIFGDSYYQERAIIAHCWDESSLAPILAEVVDAHPEVYIKSRAKRYGPEVRILLTLSAAGDARDQVERRIQSALDALIAVLATAGFGLEDLPPD